MNLVTYENFDMGNTIKRIVIDESVSNTKWRRFEDFAKKQGIGTSEYFFIRQEHPGMPDGQILHHLLSKTTIFVTTDRPFHNKVLSKGLQSYYIDDEKITGRPLRGIRFKPDRFLIKKDSIIKKNYHQPQTAIRSLLMPDSPSKLKKLNTKRRRIRNHFGGLDNLDQIAVTVSYKMEGKKNLTGIRIRVSSNVGIKAIDASESYISEFVPPEHQSIVSICHALVLVIQLTLHSVKTVVYYDADKIDHPVSQSIIDPGDIYLCFFNILSECFEHLEFVPTSKGKYMEKLRKKLGVLVGNRKTNEIVMGDILEMLNKIKGQKRGVNSWKPSTGSS